MKRFIGRSSFRNILQECQLLFDTSTQLSAQKYLSRSLHSALSNRSRSVAWQSKVHNAWLSSARCLGSAAVASPGILHSPYQDVIIPDLPFAEFIFQRCDLFPDLVAVSDYLTGRQYTFRELKEKSLRVASALHRQSYRKGDVICTFTINLPEFPILILACAYLGVIVSPANPTYKAAELSHMLTHNGACAMVTIPQLMPIVKDAIGDPDLPHNIKAIYSMGHADNGAQLFSDLMEDDGKALPDNVDIDPRKDVLVLPYSSGTTGLPKGVMLSHRNIIANMMQFRPILKMTPEERTLGLLPFFHIYGLVPVQFGSLYDGAHLITVPRFEPEIFLKAIQEKKITVLHAVPPIILFLAKHPMVSNFDVSSINFMVSGAAPLSVPLTLECQERVGCPLYQGYGLTETSPVVNLDCSPGHPGTIGHLIPNTKGKLVNPDTGEVVGVGEMGEYCMDGPQKMLGYYHNQKATDEMIDKDGWLHTGDLGYMGEDGFVVIEDRLKELIKYKGFQVAPAELEGLLLSHPAVQDAAVIGIPDDETGELPRAYIVLKHNQNATPQEVAAFIEKKVSPQKKLRGGVEIIDEIPKSPAGKILRRILKARALQTY